MFLTLKKSRDKPEVNLIKTQILQVTSTEWQKLTKGKFPPQNIEAKGKTRRKVRLSLQKSGNEMKAGSKPNIT